MAYLNGSGSADLMKVGEEVGGEWSCFTFSQTKAHSVAGALPPRDQAMPRAAALWISKVCYSPLDSFPYSCKPRHPPPRLNAAMCYDITLIY